MNCDEDEVGYWTLELVTPELAIEYIKRRGPNRPVYNARVEEYCGAQKRGEWMLTHQGIAFDKNGNLIDGQHRLLSVIESCVSIRIWVFRWVAGCEMSAIDGGLPRNVRDVATLEGIKVNTTHIAIARKFFGLSRGLSITTAWSTRATRRQVIDVYKYYEQAIRWAVQMCGHEKGSGNANFAAVIAMAWYSQDRDRLERIIDIVKSGICDSEDDSAAIKIRDLLMDSRRTGGGTKSQYSIFKKMQAGVRAFLNRKSLIKLYEAEGILFPIPEMQ